MKCHQKFPSYDQYPCTDRTKDSQPQQYYAIKQSTDSHYADDGRVNAMFRQEADVLESIRELQHPHLIDVIAAFKRGPKSYFIFPWAHGGNLREFWQHKKAVPGNAGVTWVLEQLCGLSDAIWSLHQRNCRHGDLKPDNILIFANPSSEIRLVIADVGLAKVHSQATRMRKDHTGTMSGTQKYEPPEVQNEKAARPRVYDIWSMGCICLEFIIWGLWGHEGLYTFEKKSCLHQFWEVRSPNGAVIQGGVQATMEWMRKHDPRCKEGTALGDLLALVERRLLVIEVDHNSTPTNSEKFRADSTELKKKLCNIRNHAGPDSRYLQACAEPQPHLSFLSDFRRNNVERVSRRAQHLGEDLREKVYRRLSPVELEPEDLNQDLGMGRSLVIQPAVGLAQVRPLIALAL